MASSTSGATWVVAALSKYTGEIMAQNTMIRKRWSLFVHEDKQKVH